MLGTKIEKPLKDFELYQKCAKWCNSAGNATIEEKEDYYEVVEIPNYIPTAEEIQQKLTSAVQNYMDKKAQERGYDSILSVCSYVNTGVEKFDAEGEACRAWRSAVWQKCYEILADVQAGAREIPTEEELLAELPILVW